MLDFTVRFAIPLDVKMEPGVDKIGIRVLDQGMGYMLLYKPEGRIDVISRQVIFHGTAPYINEVIRIKDIKDTDEAAVQAAFLKKGRKNLIRAVTEAPLEAPVKEDAKVEDAKA